eukprot:SAG22_NODE_1233_length_5065_cov_12.050141_6_plen_136_part_00
MCGPAGGPDGGGLLARRPEDIWLPTKAALEAGHKKELADELTQLMAPETAAPAAAAAGAEPPVLAATVQGVSVESLADGGAGTPVVAATIVEAGGTAAAGGVSPAAVVAKGPGAAAAVEATAAAPAEDEEGCAIQ